MKESKLPSMKVLKNRLDDHLSTYYWGESYINQVGSCTR